MTCNRGMKCCCTKKTKPLKKFGVKGMKNNKATVSQRRFNRINRAYMYME